VDDEELERIDILRRQVLDAADDDGSVTIWNLAWQFQP
jgi:hypothetical protein